MVGCQTLESGTEVVRAEEAEVDTLLVAIQSDVDTVRDSALRSLQALIPALPKSGEVFDNLVRRVWVAKCDPAPETRELAEKFWKSAGLAVDSSLGLLEDVAHPVAVVREAACEALASFLADHGEQTGAVLTQLLKRYTDNLEMAPPVMNNFDNWESRSGIASALAKIQPFYDKFMVSQVVRFFMTAGMEDRNEVVRKHMLSAAVATIDNHGKDTVGELLPVFEDYLQIVPDESSNDIVSQFVVILMGSLAKHLHKDDHKVRKIVGKLINALTSTSQLVQEAVAKCLPPLTTSIKDKAQDLVGKLLQVLLNNENFRERKGAAYGLACVVKGLGILSLKQLDIMDCLTEALQYKNDHRHREGSMLALSQLCAMLGKQFEPYIVNVLPHLLLCFGDPNQYVREARGTVPRQSCQICLPTV